VYKVTRKSDGIQYALKKVRMLNLSEKEKENALNEIRILASIHNHNIISYKEAFIDEPSLSVW
jgi:NIMA (never in mitosis gene a)-related kinase